MADVFISYHRSESASVFVRRIAANLESMGISCWYDTKDPDAGYFAQTIEQEILNCKVFLLIWDQGADNSEWCKAEVHRAFNSNNHPIRIPFQLGSFKKGDGIAFYMERCQTFYDEQTVISKIANLLKKSETQPTTSKPTAQQQMTQRKSANVLVNNLQAELAMWKILCSMLAFGIIILICILNRPIWSTNDGELTIYKMGHIGTPWAKDNVASICISGNINKIRNGAFKDCKNLKKVVISKGVTKIGNESFYGCSNLYSVTIPESVTEIGEKAFAACTNLESVDVPNSVTSISRWTFSGCVHLAQVKCPKIHFLFKLGLFGIVTV